jgi:hypothetical protein
MVSHPYHPGPPVIPAFQRRRRISHAEKQHPGSDQPVCDRPEPAGRGMMQLLYPMLVEMSEDNEPRQYDIYIIALPEKRHLIWNQISY